MPVRSPIEHARSRIGIRFTPAGEEDKPSVIVAPKLPTLEPNCIPAYNCSTSLRSTAEATRPRTRAKGSDALSTHALALRQGAAEWVEQEKEAARILSATSNCQMRTGCMLTYRACLS